MWDSGSNAGCSKSSALGENHGTKTYGYHECPLDPKNLASYLVYARDRPLVIAMWFKRYIIIVPTLTVGNSLLQSYIPSWIEIVILGGSFAALALMYTLLLKLIPIIEMEEPHNE